jgi:hypothetical protein
MAFSDKVPQYRVDMNISGTTNAWVLGVSALGSGTILKTTPDAYAGLTTLSKPPLSATITRGRTDELGQIQAGTMTVELDNSDGALSPANTASPYYPNVVPERQIALSAQFGAGQPWVMLFFGYVESIVPHDNGPVDSTVTISASDWLARAAIAPVTGTRTAEADWTRFQWLVGQIGSDGLPASLVGPTSGLDTLMGLTYAAGTTGITALQDIATATLGVIYVSRVGYPTFRTRYGKFTVRGSFWNSGYIFDQVGLNTAANVMPYLPPLNLDMTLQYLYDDIHITGSDGVDHVWQSDAVTLQRYGIRTYQLQSASLDPSRADNIAFIIRTAYEKPQVKVHAITMDGDAWLNGGTVSPWAILFNFELGDSVTVVKSQPANASFHRDMFIEQITHTIEPNLGGHTVSLQLSDQALSGITPWILGTSQLGHNTNIVY